MEYSINEENVTATTSYEDVRPTSTYDHDGAMKFIVATILLYSLLGVVTMLISRLRKRKNERRSKDEDIAKYLKSEKRLRPMMDREKIRARKLLIMQYIESNPNISSFEGDADHLLWESRNKGHPGFAKTVKSCPQMNVQHSPTTVLNYEDEQQSPKSKSVSFFLGNGNQENSEQSV